MLLFMVTITGTTFSEKPIKASKNQLKIINIKSFEPDIIIPDDYTSIREGVDNANPGDKILVRSGIYKENIVIDKEDLILHGENKFTTVLDGGKTTDTIIVSAQGITLQNFTIQNGWNKNELLWYISGVKILSSNVIIKNNIFTKNRLGINTGPTASNLTISDNEFIDDGLLIGSFEYLQLTEENFYHNITNNTVNGKPLYYYTREHNFTVPNDAGQIILVNCTNTTITDMHITQTDFSILLAFCSNCVIENNVVEDTDGEIILAHSKNCVIQNNTASHSLHGICLDYQSKNNIVRYNEVYDNRIGISSMTSSYNNIIHNNIAYGNKQAGIWILNQSYDNIISKNEIYNNGKGFRISRSSSQNIFQNNNIKNNIIGVLLESSSNDNMISNNNFKSNLLSALFIGCSRNDWNHNYWDRPRILPKPVIGLKIMGKIPVPWMNVDRHPARQPIIV